MEDTLINGDEIIVPPMTDGDIPLTPEVVANDITNTPTEPSDIGTFFGSIQESITIAWRYHLKTNKHHIHTALNEYYNAALYIIDKIIEAYQGTSGTIVDNYTNMIYDYGKTEVEYLNELRTFIVDSKSKFMFESEINSEIDNLLSLVDSTIYKITSFCEHAIKTFEEFCFEDYDVIGIEGGVDGVFDTVTKTTKTETSKENNTESEGGVDGVFDNITKTTKTNVAPIGSECSKKSDKKSSDCDDEEEEE